MRTGATAMGRKKVSQDQGSRRKYEMSGATAMTKPQYRRKSYPSQSLLQRPDIAHEVIYGSHDAQDARNQAGNSKEVNGIRQSQDKLDA
jgi:hypothetical protein